MSSRFEIARSDRPILAHLAALSLLCSWAYGGQAGWVREVTQWLGTVGAIMFAHRARAKFQGSFMAGARMYAWIWPLALFDLLTLVACLNPSFRETVLRGESHLVVQDPPFAWLPSSADPRAALQELWLWNGVILSCANIAHVVSRHSLRLFLAVNVGNAAVLAVYGIFQKITAASGLWFGLEPSPNVFFFATFIYHNHWGAFSLANLAACLGLVAHHWIRGKEEGDRHSPVLAGLLTALLIMATLPLSGSRSCTAIGGVVLGVSCIYLLCLKPREQRLGATRSQRSILLTLGLAGAIAAIFFLAKPVIETRVRHTVQQLEAVQANPEQDSRLQLYRDTWRAAMDRPWFGWGLDSYSRVFQIYNSQRPDEPWFKVRYFTEAHSDWLQSLAESGFVGTALLVWIGIAGLTRNWWRPAGSSLPQFLLGGCAVMLAYAWVELPFANLSVMVAFWTLYFAGNRLATLDQPPPEKDTR